MLRADPIDNATDPFGFNRTRYTGIHGARTWCGHGVFNHNLIKIAVLHRHQLSDPGTKPPMLEARGPLPRPAKP